MCTIEQQRLLLYYLFSTRIWILSVKVYLLPSQIILPSNWIKLVCLTLQSLKPVLLQVLLDILQKLAQKERKKRPVRLHVLPKGYTGFNLVSLYFQECKNPIRKISNVMLSVQKVRE